MADERFPMNPRAITGPPKMSLVLEAKSMPALIIKSRLILVMLTDDVGWYITSNQQGHMFVQNLNTIIRKPNITPGQIQYCTTDCISVDLIFQEYFLSGNRGSLNIVLIAEDPKIRSFTALRDPSTNNRNTGNKSLDNCTKK